MCAASGGAPWLAPPRAVGQERARQPRRREQERFVAQQLLQQPRLLPPQLGGGSAEGLRVMLPQVVRQAGHLLRAHPLRISRVQPRHPLPQLVRIGAVPGREAP
jgi:hypothetical protein